MQRRLRPLTASLALAASAALVSLVGCGGSNADPANTLVLYNGQHEQTANALIAAFEQKTGITVQVRSDDEDVLANQIVQEGANSPADLFYTENSPALAFLSSKGLLSSVTPSTLAEVPAQYDSPQGDWVGVSARVSVLVYNTNMLQASQLPTSITQLADPRWKGLIGIAPSETDFQPIVTSLDMSEGATATVHWLEALKTNAGDHTYPDNETLVAQVNSGAVAIGVINNYYWYRERAEIGASGMHSKIAFFAPRDPGYVVDVSGAAVLKSSHHQANAERFLAFLVSPQGQQIIANTDSFEYPLDPSIPAAGGQIPFASLQPNPISIAQLGTGATAVALLQQAQLI
jgi:iron(III) transport system substrate-binding protein